MRFVAVGGGHGTAVSLRALKRLSPDVTGVVSVADDGGSTGRLRAMLNVAAVGDIRKCLVALADPDNPLTASFEHRFTVGELERPRRRESAARRAHRRDRQPRRVRARARSGHGRDGHHPARELRGRRARRDDRRGRDSRPDRGRSHVGDTTDQPGTGTPAAPIDAVEAIERADVVLIGPGSLFTSVIAACVVPGITQALAGTRAKKIYIANLHPELPETKGFTLARSPRRARASRRERRSRPRRRAVVVSERRV